jgi:F-type H+-transporting ATPase subunit a
MLLFAAAEAHHDPNAMDHVMNTDWWEITHTIGFSTYPVSKFTLLMLLAAAIICAIYIPLANHIQKGGIPRGTFWNLFESLLEFIRNNVVKPYISHHADNYVPFLWTIFLFILMCNLLGMIPFLGSPTAHFGVTIVLAFIVFVMMNVWGILENGFKGHLLAAFVPPLDLPLPLKAAIYLILVPIEFVGLIIRCAVLAVRLFANMFAGHMVLATIILFVYSAWMVVPGAEAMPKGLSWTITVGAVLGSIALSLLELFVAFLQAFIFTFLTALFLGSILHPEH